MFTKKKKLFHNRGDWGYIRVTGQIITPYKANMNAPFCGGFADRLWIFVTFELLKTAQKRIYWYWFSSSQFENGTNGTRRITLFWIFMFVRIRLLIAVRIISYTLDTHCNTRTRKCKSTKATTYHINIVSFSSCALKLSVSRIAPSTVPNYLGWALGLLYFGYIRTYCRTLMLFLHETLALFCSSFCIQISCRKSH